VIQLTGERWYTKREWLEGTPRKKYPAAKLLGTKDIGGGVRDDGCIYYGLAINEDGSLAEGGA